MKKTDIGMSIYMDDIRGNSRNQKRNKKWCKHGKGEENEVKAKEDKIYYGKDRKWERTEYKKMQNQ